MPFLLADGGMDAVVAMEPRLALLAVAARAAPFPPPFFIAGCVGCVKKGGGGGEGRRSVRRGWKAGRQARWPGEQDKARQCKGMMLYVSVGLVCCE